MKICFVCDEYPPGVHGGIGTCVQVLGRALAAAGHDVRVVGAYRSGYGGADYEMDAGVRVWRLRESAHRLGWVAARAAVYRTVRRWARRGEIELVEVPDYAGWAAGWPPLPIPVVVRMNGSMAFFARELGTRVRRTTYLLERASLRRSDAWSAASRYTAELSARVFALASAPSAILYNPVEAPPPDATPRARSRTDVVFTGTLTEKKGVVSLVRAWPHVVTANPLATLHVYGKDGRAPDGGSMREYLTACVPAAVRDTVRFHGHVTRERLFDALASARAAVFPSYSEAFGIAPFEAMARGCPTIYTRRGPGPELVRDEVDGLLVEPDHPHEIAAALGRLLADDALAARLGAAGRRHVSATCSTEVMLARNEAFFAQSIARFRGRPRGGSVAVARA